MGAQASILTALETRLDAIAPAIATAWENVSYIPVQDVPYQRVKHIPAEPENPTLSGEGFVRLRGIMNVCLFYPQAGGPADALARAELIRAQFKRGLSLSNGGVVVTIDRTPEIAPAQNDEDRYVLPVNVRYFANVITP